MTDDRTQLVDNIRIAISSANSEEDVLQKAVELIDGYSDHFDWTGFYLLKDGKLKVGPYVGPETPHKEIELNQGICGAAASNRRTIIVDDVRKDERFLACSLSTRSEIVVPLMDGEIVLGEIDIDSNQPSHFTKEDREMLERIASVVVDRLKQI